MEGDKMIQMLTERIDRQERIIKRLKEDLKKDTCETCIHFAKPNECRKCDRTYKMYQWCGEEEE